LPGTAGGVERVGRTVKDRPMFRDEELPRSLTTGPARAGECQVLEVKRGQIPFDLAHRGRDGRKRAMRAGSESLPEPGNRQGPPGAFCPMIELRHYLVVERPRLIGSG